MMTIYGISLGSATSAIAKVYPDIGIPELIMDPESGMERVATAVYALQGNALVIGEEALEEGSADPGHLATDFYPVIGTPEGERRLESPDGTVFSAEKLCEMVFRKIIGYADMSGEAVQDVVITCPPYFAADQKAALVRAGNAAGLRIHACINEQQAALACYCSHLPDGVRNILVYDLGGRALKVMLVRVEQHEGRMQMRVLGYADDLWLGGYVWTQVLYDMLCEAYEEIVGGYTEELPEELAAVLRSQAEKLKIRLSVRDQVRTRVRYEEGSISLTVDRESFEARAASYVDLTAEVIDRALESAAMQDDAVDQVLMVGGGAKMPMIRRLLTDRFGDRVAWYQPDALPAKGAAIVGECWCRTGQMLL